MKQITADRQLNKEIIMLLWTPWVTITENQQNRYNNKPKLISSWLTHNGHT
jgi:hypothetical protein